MDFNATLVGQLIIVFALVMGCICYYLGRRKTQSPVLAGLIGAGLSIVPILGVVYLVVLLLKKDINTTSSAVNI
ncbi:hypothetical protein [Shewanella sp.]|uniref:hypothetical protein n=1 Tax=Shewanella sp. TaxID=50422 RepID=UPI0040475579